MQRSPKRWRFVADRFGSGRRRACQVEIASSSCLQAPNRQCRYHSMQPQPDSANMRSALIPFQCLVLVVTATLSIRHAHAWGVQAHQAIALVAQGALSPAARAQVDRLLASEPGSTLASISTWADEHRGPTTASWHYVNFPVDQCDYVPPRDCPGDACIVEATKRQLAVLASQADVDILPALRDGDSYGAAR